MRRAVGPSSTVSIHAKTEARPDVYSSAPSPAAPNTVDALVGLAYVSKATAIRRSRIADRPTHCCDAHLDLEPNRATAYFVLGLLRESQGGVLVRRCASIGHRA